MRPPQYRELPRRALTPDRVYRPQEYEQPIRETENRSAEVTQAQTPSRNFRRDIHNFFINVQTNNTNTNTNTNENTNKRRESFLFNFVLFLLKIIILPFTLIYFLLNYLLIKKRWWYIYVSESKRQKFIKQRQKYLRKYLNKQKFEEIY